MRTLLILALSLSIQLSFSQNKTYQTYSSLKYKYSIEYQTSFVKKEIIGKNIDFKVADKYGNSIIIVVNKLMPQQQNMKASDLLKISNEAWQTNLQLPNVKVIKKGSVSVDNQEGMYIHYTSTELNNSSTLYYTNYFFIYSGYMYTLTATCDIKDLTSMQPVFFRALQSFTFPK